MTAPLLRYTAARFALFGICYSLCVLVGLEGAVAILAGLVLSALASAALLGRLRDAIAEAAETRRAARLTEKQRLREKLGEDAG